MFSRPGSLGPWRLVVPRPLPFFLFFFSVPPCLLHLLVPGSVCCGPWRSVVLLGPPLCFSSSFFSSSPPSLFLFCPGVLVVRFSGWFVSPGLWAVLMCVAVSLSAPWLCPICVCCCLSRCGVVVCFELCLVLCGLPVLGLVLDPRCCPLLPSPGHLSWPVVVFCPGVRCRVALVCPLSCGLLLWCRVVSFALAGAVWCCLWLLAVRCCVWLFAVVSCRPVLSRVLLPGRVACCPAVCCGLLWRPAPLCFVLCSVVLDWCVEPCCGALWSFFPSWWCWFVSLPWVCGAVLRCASCCSLPVWSALLLVPRAVACRRLLWCLPGRSAVWWCCSCVLSCLAVMCVVLWCPAPCAVSCGAVLPCGVVLAGCAVRLGALLVFVFPLFLCQKPLLFFRAFENVLKTKKKNVSQ